MAKKKAARKVTKKTATGKNILGETETRRRPQTITSEEVQELAGHLCASGSGNIYAMARNRFNIECADDGDDEFLFKRIKDQCGVFRCELCGQWLDTSEENCNDVCNDCAGDVGHEDGEE